jgi:phospholipid/cholesterol/gamma-HCH transport system substrate-binding protein
MQKRAPTLANILVILLFALSCFGLMLFLWESFGGPVPLKPKGYRFTVDLHRTLALAEESDVRINGVNVGHVVSLQSHTNGFTDVTIEIAHQYAPIGAGDRLMLRQKTLLGETYVELFPTPKVAPRLPDGGRIPIAQVRPAVTLDDILATLDPRTRRDFQLWQQGLAESFNGRGEQINSGFAELQPVVEHANQLVRILASQEGAVQATVHSTGVVFDALTERDHQLRGLIVNGDRATQALAQSSRQFAEAFRELPAFERNSTATLRELDSLAAAGSPLLDQSRAWELQLAPTLKALQAATPDLNSLLTDLGPLTSASEKGLPALERSLTLLTPLLAQFTPVLRNIDPLLQFNTRYIPELQSLFANVTAASEAHDINADLNDPSSPQQHYLRVLATVNPEDLTSYTQRIGTNRANPYPQPGAFNLLGNGGLQSFSTAACADSAPSVSGPPNEAVSQAIIEQLISEHVANAPESGNSVGAPACTQQSPFTWEGHTSQYPQVTAPSK